MLSLTDEEAGKPGGITLGSINNEPVAWMLADKEAEHIRSIMAVQHDFVPEGCVEIPLYTHPVKELTDEEILQVMMNVYSDTVPPIRGIEFARAILRKAQGD